MAGLAAKASIRPMPISSAHAGQRHLVDREPPIGETALVGARDAHDAALHPGFARQLRHQGAESIAALLEILELVVGGAGRRQQHHRRGRGRCRGIGGGGCHRLVQRAATFHRAPCRPGCGRRHAPPRRSDRPCGCGGNSPPGFRCRLPWPCRPRSRKYRDRQASARAVASALVALESLMKRALPMCADIFHAMGQAGKAGDGGGDGARVLHERLGRRHRPAPHSANCARRADAARRPAPSPWLARWPSARHRARHRPRRCRGPAPCPPKPAMAAAPPLADKPVKIAAL